LVLSSTPLTSIEELDRSNDLPYDVLEEFLPGMIRSLRFLMSSQSLDDRKQPLNHKFFSLDKSFPQVRHHKSFLHQWKKLC
jgi:hypothetical protein